MNAFTARRWDSETVAILTDDPQHGGITVAHVYETKDDEKYTRLIEAAPKLLDERAELLEALTHVLKLVEDGVVMRHETGKPTWSLTAEIKKIARAAILKVEAK